MKKKTSKEDRLVFEIMKDYSMDQPSAGFTERVMDNILLENIRPVLKDSPLINRAGWIGIAAGFLAIILLVMFTGNTQAGDEADWLTRFLSRLPSLNLSLKGIFDWLSTGDSTVFWIFVGIGGLVLVVFIDRLLENFRKKHFYLLE